MPMLFEPLQLRKGFEEFMLEMTLSTQDDRSAAMGNIAAEHVGDVIDAWLVGLETKIAPALPRALDWLDRAIRNDEDFGASRDLHRLTLLWARAIGSWMHRGTRDAAAWEAVRVQSRVTAKDPEAYSPDQIPTEWLDDYMAFCVLAGQWQEGIAEYERLHGARAPAIDRKLEPRDVGYARCLHEARGAFDSAQVFAAGRRMLAAKLEDAWLGRGQKLRAVTWLDAVYGRRDASLTPRETILSAYDNMPKVSRPEFVRAN
jgi:hypothetical protein